MPSGASKVLKNSDEPLETLWSYFRRADEAPDISDDVTNRLRIEAKAKIARNTEHPIPADGWRRVPETIQDRMALESARKGAGKKLIDNLGDPRYRGFEKWEYKVKSAAGADTVIHYVRDPSTGKLSDFKFK